MPDVDYERLTRIFAALLAPAALGGCSLGGIDEDQFSVDVCSPWMALDSVQPSESVDFMELRGHYEFDDPATGFDSLETTGMACATATDPAACADTLAALDPTSEVYESGFDGRYYYQLAYTRGDEVDAVRSRSALEAFFGTIDAPGEAALLATFAGHDLNCAAGAEVGEHSEGYVVFTRSGSGCGPGDDVEHHLVLVRADGTIEVLESELIEKGDPNCAIGRLPAGLCRRPSVAVANPVGAFLANVATLEAAAVPAFAQLGRELALHRAPRRLVRAAARAHDDEVVHARIMAGLARRHGGRPQRPQVLDTPPRSLTAVAEDNAIEGCVRETYGALVAHAQARRAQTPALRRAFARIARDETRHAALSWGLARWARVQLSPRERVRVARRQTAAIERLRVELTGAHDPRVHAITGLPRPSEARALFEGLTRALA